jgi:hypothetical protein
MSWAQNVDFENVRTVDWSSIGATYSAVGARSLYPCRAICITNDTDGAMYFTNDGVNDKLYVPANSFKLFDLTTNKGGSDGIFVLQQNTQISVRYSVAPSEGLVAVEFLYGKGD